MSFSVLMLLAFSLAMDAFAVALCRGLALQQCKRRDMLIIGLYFGFFQALMPFLGYLLGIQFLDWIETLQGMLVPLFLGIIGVNMIKESFVPLEDDVEKEENLPSMWVMLGMAVATSIDAFAVGVSFSSMPISIVQAVIVIGIITFFLSGLGLQLGHLFGLKYKAKAELLGGIILLYLATGFMY